MEMDSCMTSREVIYSRATWREKANEKMHSGKWGRGAICWMLRPWPPPLVKTCRTHNDRCQVSRPTCLRIEILNYRTVFVESFTPKSGEAVCFRRGREWPADTLRGDCGRAPLQVRPPGTRSRLTAGSEGTRLSALPFRLPVRRGPRILTGYVPLRRVSACNPRRRRSQPPVWHYGHRRGRS